MYRSSELFIVAPIVFDIIPWHFKHIFVHSILNFDALRNAAGYEFGVYGNMQVHDSCAI